MFSTKNNLSKHILYVACSGWRYKHLNTLIVLIFAKQEEKTNGNFKKEIIFLHSFSASIFQRWTSSRRRRKWRKKKIFSQRYKTNIYRKAEIHSKEYTSTKLFTTQKFSPFSFSLPSRWCMLSPRSIHIRIPYYIIWHTVKTFT